MKKLLCILLCVALGLTCACGAKGTDKTNQEKNEDQGNEATKAPETTEGAKNQNEQTETDENQIAGDDWRTYKGYAIIERVNDGIAEDVYVEAVQENGVVRLIKDSKAYNLIQAVQTMHEKIYDVVYLESNIMFMDMNGDGVEDLIIPDLIGEEIIAEVFLYDATLGEYVYSELESIKEATRRNSSGNVPGAYEIYHWEYESVLQTVAAEYPENQYFLYDVNRDGVSELVIQTCEDGSYEIYFPSYDGETVVGARSAGVVGGSEQGTFAYDEDGKLLMNRFVQGVRYVMEVTITDQAVDEQEIYAAEEEEYGFTGTELALCPVTDSFAIYE